MNTFIASFGILDADGLHSPAGSTPWHDGQSGPLDVERSQVYDKPHMGFGKLCAPEKLAFAAASLALRGMDLPEDRSAIGIVIGSVFGSLSTDRAFAASATEGFPSPALFAATLPSTPLAEIAIMHKLTGPNRVFCGMEAARDAIAASIRILDRGIAEQIVCCCVADGADGSGIWAATLILAAAGEGAIPAGFIPLSPLPSLLCPDPSYFRNLVKIH